MKLIIALALAIAANSASALTLVESSKKDGAELWLEPATYFDGDIVAIGAFTTNARAYEARISANADVCRGETRAVRYVINGTPITRSENIVGSKALRFMCGFTEREATRVHMHNFLWKGSKQ